MESITLFVSIVIIVFGILQIILFFKIWGMTNNVSEILSDQKDYKKEVIKKMNNIISTLEKEENPFNQKDFHVDDTVICIKTGDILTITDIDSLNRKFFCVNYKNNSGRYYTEKEIRKSE